MEQTPLIPIRRPIIPESPTDPLHQESVFVTVLQHFFDSIGQNANSSFRACPFWTGRGRGSSSRSEVSGSWEQLAAICRYSEPHTTCYNRFVRWRRARTDYGRAVFSPTRRSALPLKLGPICPPIQKPVPPTSEVTPRLAIGEWPLAASA